MGYVLRVISRVVEQKLHQFPLLYPFGDHQERQGRWLYRQTVQVNQKGGKPIQGSPLHSRSEVLRGGQLRPRRTRYLPGETRGHQPERQIGPVPQGLSQLVEQGIGFQLHQITLSRCVLRTFVLYQSGNAQIVERMRQRYLWVAPNENQIYSGRHFTQGNLLLDLKPLSVLLPQELCQKGMPVNCHARFLS